MWIISLCQTCLLQWGMDGRQKTIPLYLFFDGPVSAEVLRERVCSCRGRNICASNCVCGTNSLQCTEICPYQGDDKCQNELNKTLVEDIEISEEVFFIEDFISSRELFHFACVNQTD